MQKKLAMLSLAVCLFNVMVVVLQPRGRYPKTPLFQLRSETENMGGQSVFFFSLQMILVAVFAKTGFFDYVALKVGKSVLIIRGSNYI